VYRDSGSEYEASSGSSKTVMMGCRCDDIRGDDIRFTRMQITCAYAFFDHNAYVNYAGDDFISEVEFQTDSTGNYLQCRHTEISVKSIK
jgi:hypothetical protein